MTKRLVSESGIEDDELCPSMYSFHSSVEEKNKLLSTLMEYGIETTVDRAAKKDRIREWIQSSVIEEQDEDEQHDSGVEERETSPIVSRKSSTITRRTNKDGYSSSIGTLTEVNSGSPSRSVSY